MELTQEIESVFKVEPAAIGHHISGSYMKPEIKPVCDEMKIIGRPIPSG